MTHRHFRAVSAVCFALACAAAAPATRPADDLTVLPPAATDASPRKMLYRYLLGQAHDQFDARRKAVAAVKTPEDVKRRGDELRAKFVDALGGFPDKTPLNARTIGVRQFDGYRVERVVYESRPGHHVTANLYLPGTPADKGPFPAILMPCGHSANGKADGSYQRAAVLFARNGLAAMSYDPIGQAERRQLLDADGKPVGISMTTEHSLVGTAALLVGQCTAGFRAWDGIRSLDYLCKRPEIDPKRLGCTGCSGGGALTSYLMALDDRIAAAAPSCYVTSLERLFETIGPQDAEQNVPGQVAFGMEHADYLTMRVPRPTLLCAASRDFFDIQGTWTTFREAKRVYGVAGHAERLDIAEFDTTHGYPKPQREAVVRFMRRWLLGKDDAPTEGDIQTLKDADLQCTASGQVLTEFKGGRSVPDLIADQEKAMAAGRGEALGNMGRGAFAATVRRLIALPELISAAKETAAGEVGRDRYTIRKRVFETEPGVSVPASLFEPAAEAATDERSPLVLYVHGRGKAADAGPGGPIEGLVLAGRRVLALDLRGTGETAPGTPPAAGKPDYLGVDFSESYLALHLARPLLGQRVFDLLSVVEALSPAHADGFEVVGVGAAGPVVLHAAALDGRIKRVTVSESVVSWSAVARSPVSQDQLTNAVPGVLKAYDLPDLGRLIAPRPLTVRDATDPSGKPITQRAMAEPYAPTVEAYQREGAAAHVVLKAAAP